MPLATRTALRLASSLVAATAAGAGLIVFGVIPSSAQTNGSGCSQYGVYDALGNGDGVQTVQAAPGATLVSSVDGQLPGSQADFSSEFGSTAWAGAPYSDAVAGNVGNANVDPNQVPIFAVSRYPTPKSAQNSTPLATLSASSTAQSSTSKAQGGTPPVGPATSGQISTSASASCADDGTLTGVADNQTQALNIEGVLRIGSVSSHASAIVNSANAVTLDGTMSVEGVFAEGQAVAITNQGLELAGTSVPLPDNPLTQSLAQAGITVQYLGAIKQSGAGTGQVEAPGLEITVTGNDQGLGVGAGTITTTYVLGRAFASVKESGGSGTPLTPITTPVTIPAADNPGSSTPSGATSGSALATSDAVGTPGATSQPSLGSAVPAAGRGSTGAIASAPATAMIANASSSSFYIVLLVGSLIVLGSLVTFGVLGVRIRWR